MRGFCFFWSGYLSMTDMTLKRSIELQSFKTENLGSNMALTFLKFLKEGNKSRIKQLRTIYNQT